MSRTPSETNTAVAFGETTTDTAHVADSTTNQYDSDVITIVRDEKNALGKHFELLPGRKVKKSSVVTVSVGRAVQRSVKSPQDLKLILEEVSEDSHAAIINAGFKDIPVGEEFFILSEAVLRDKLKTKERSNLIGVHTLAHKTLGDVSVCGRLKENVFPSSWQLLDRDIDEHTPEQYGKAMAYTDWIKELDAILPGLAQTTIVRAASTSARVLDSFSSIPVGDGNGHTWIKVSDPTRVELIRHAISLRSIAQGLAWKKPRFSKATGEVVGHSWTTIVDASVWTPGRLVFNGKPTVTGDLEVDAQSIQIIEKEGPVLDISAIELPAFESIERISREGGCAVKVRQSNKGLRVDQFNLSLSTELDTEDYGTISVREALTKEGKVRCQAPFRSSESFAAFLGKSEEGRPFVHDVGTATNHWLCDKELAEQEARSRQSTLENWRAQIRSAADEFTLREMICPAIARDSLLNESTLEALVSEVNNKLGSLTGSKPGVATVRKMLKKPAEVVSNADSENPLWLKDWYFVTSKDKFFRYDTEEWLSSKGFDMRYSRNLPSDERGERPRASTIACDFFEVPVVHRAVYLPSAKPFFTDSGTKCVNTYRPSSVPDAAEHLTSADRKAIKFVEQHIANICGGRDDVARMLVDWLAYNVQNPGRKIRYAIVIQGVEGDGKSSIGDMLSYVMGEKNVSPVSVKSINSDFSAWAEGCCVATVAELMMHGKNRFDVINAIKPCITDHKVVIIGKGKDQYSVPNTVNYFTTTNHRDAIPLTSSDRRWFVIFAPWRSIEEFQEYVGRDRKEYFDELAASLNCHAPALRKWLLDREISSDFNPNGHAPATSEKTIMVALGEPDDIAMSKELIAFGQTKGLYPELVSSSHLTEALSRVPGMRVPQGKAVKSLLDRLQFKPTNPPSVNWRGEPCRVWSKAAVTGHAKIVELLDAAERARLHAIKDVETSRDFGEPLSD